MPFPSDVDGQPSLGISHPNQNAQYGEFPGGAVA